MGGHGGVEVGGAAGFGEQQARESGGLGALGDATDLRQRLRDRHHVNVHGAHLNAPRGWRSAGRAECRRRAAGTEEVPLHRVAAVLLEQVGRFRVADALGHGGQTECRGQLDQRAGDGGGSLVAQDRLDELTVEFDIVDGQFAQIGQRRVAAAEVVDRHPNAGLAKSIEHRAGLGKVGD